MKKTTRQGLLVTVIVLAILLIDQTLKLWVKGTMCLHDSIRITEWFYITFIENNGMAYGMTFIPKYALSVFRLVACIALVWYLRKAILDGARTLWLVLIAMVLAGAAGNLIDCMFYGMMFTDSTPYTVSCLTEFGSGYSSFLQGRVVDMFYFPLIVTTYPEWLPIWGGQSFIFFSPVFNFADASISVAVVALVLFCRRELTALHNS